MLVRKIIAILSLSVFIVLGCKQDNGSLNIDPLVKYAQQFTPCTTEGDCRNLYKTPDEIREILEKHEITDAYKVSVMLVLLKHYNYEYSTFHQGYEIRRGASLKQSAFVNAYLRITGGNGVDHMTARVAYDWIKSHPEYLDHELIALEVNKIKETEKKIEDMIR